MITCPEARSNWERAIIAASAAHVWNNTIIAGTVGSVVHGLNLSESDYDIMGVCIEPLERVVGFKQFEQFIYRTASQREIERVKGCLAKTGISIADDQIDPHNARSEANDIDLTIYSLRKYLRLALNGNPSILTLLYVPREHLQLRPRCNTCGKSGMDLQSIAPMIISKRAGGAFLGYMQAQKQRLLGERGGKHGVRADRINKFGYDSKYAMHILRLGCQGIELMETGKLTLPMPEQERAHLRTVRMGKVELNLVLQSAGDLERRLKDAIEASSLPNSPNTEAVEEWMVDQYRTQWDAY